MRETVTLRVVAGKKRELEVLSDRLGVSTSAITAAFLEAGVDALKESDKTVDNFLAPYLDERSVGRPAEHPDG